MTPELALNQTSGSLLTLPAETSDRRGLLDLKVSLSNPSPTAGSNFTLNLLVTNLFDVPIWPESPQVFLPSELETVHFDGSDAASLASVETLIDQVAKGLIPPLDPLLITRPNLLQRWFPKFFKFQCDEVAMSLRNLALEVQKLEAALSIAEIKRDEAKSSIDEKTAKLTLEEKTEALLNDKDIQALVEKLSTDARKAEQIRGRTNALTDQIVALSGTSAIITDGDLRLENFQVPKKMYIRAKGKVILESPLNSRIVALDSSLRPRDALQPGNTVVYSIGLTTRRQLLFRPLQYSLQHSLNFSFDANRSTVHTNTVSQQLTIRASIGAVMVGATLGGCTGFSARLLLQHTAHDYKGPIIAAQIPAIITGLLLTAILSAMAIVFLARKSETQSMVSIEDFWGGLVIGFLVGYTGSSAFEKISGAST